MKLKSISLWVLAVVLVGQLKAFCAGVPALLNDPVDVSRDCLPADNHLHAISMTKSGQAWKLENDPLASKVAWKISDGIAP